jgi:oxygen-independent coproporphyrinogen-3 oxidase
MTGDLPIEVAGVKLPMTEALLDKYNVEGPRYTSYPTALDWSEDVGPAAAEDACRAANAAGPDKQVSVYLHLPFCESQCWFCGCFMKVIPRKDRGEGRGEIVTYLDALHGEIDLWADRIDADRPVTQVHWGGGTPTYLTVAQADRLPERAAPTTRPTTRVSLP